MKRYTIYVIVLMLSMMAADVHAQRYVNIDSKHSVGAGLRVGLGSMMQKSDDEASDRTSGFDGAAEFVYTYYFATKKQSAVQLGIRTGASLGFRQNSITMPLVDIKYSEKDAQGHSITYHATAENVKETDRQFALEIPIMFAACHNRLFGNIGLRAGIPMMSRYSQTMDNPTLSATYEDYEVTLFDEKVSGRVSNDDEKQKAKLDASSFNLCLSFEAGYTFHLLGSKLQAGIYTDYGLVDNYKGKGEKFTEANPSTINGATNTPATVVVHSLTDSYVDNVGIFCVGLRAIYTLTRNSGQKRHSNYPRNSR